MFSSDSASADEAQESAENFVIVARGRISDTKKLFADRGWKVLPDTTRGRSILEWACDHVWLAAPENLRVVRVRRWCLRWAPWLTREEASWQVERTKTSNKLWTHDQCGMVLELSVRDLERLGFRFLGACDDPDYEERDLIKQKKDAERQRRHRAKHSSGRPRGRPGLDLSEADKTARKRKQSAEGSQRHRAANSSSGAKRGRPKAEVPAYKLAGFSSKRTYQRHKARGTVSANGTKNVCSKNPSRHLRKNIDSVTDLNVTDFRCHFAKMPASDLRKLVLFANITAPLTEIGIFDWKMAA